MAHLQQLLYLFAAAVALSAFARKVGAPYPVFLALGSTLIALLPVGPAFSLPPDVGKR